MNIIETAIKLVEAGENLAEFLEEELAGNITPRYRKAITNFSDVLEAAAEAGWSRAEKEKERAVIPTVLRDIADYMEEEA